MFTLVLFSQKRFYIFIESNFEVFFLIIYFDDVVSMVFVQKIQLVLKIHLDQNQLVQFDDMSFEQFVFEPLIDKLLLDNKNLDVVFELLMDNV